MKGYLRDGYALSIKVANKGNLHVHWALRLQTMVPSCALSIKIAKKGTTFMVCHLYNWLTLIRLWSHSILVGFFVLVLLDLDKTVLCSSVLVLLLGFLRNLTRDITLGHHCEDTSCTVREHDWCKRCSYIVISKMVTYSIFWQYFCQYKQYKRIHGYIHAHPRFWSHSLSFWQ
jgi:hypothetical protein